MNNHEFTLALKSLHLQQKHISEWFNINRKTVERWGNGDFKIGDTVTTTLKQWQAWAESSAQALFAQAIDMYAEHGGTPDMVLIIYGSEDFASMVSPELPTHVHQSAIARAQFLMEAQGFKVVVVKMRRTDYTAWLDGRDDSQPLRSAWASEPN